MSATERICNLVPDTIETLLPCRKRMIEGQSTNSKVDISQLYMNLTILTERSKHRNDERDCFVTTALIIKDGPVNFQKTTRNFNNECNFSLEVFNY